MGESYTQEEMAEYLKTGRLPKKGAEPARRVPSHASGRMNKTEQAYARRLELQKTVGEVRDFKFERITLKLADDCRYTPDFLVEPAAGPLELHEVKGAFVREDARVKLKTAAELFPQFTFVFAQYVKGSWIVVPVRRAP